MGEIFQFVPKAASSAAENLNAFIARCRKDLIVFGKDLNWSAEVWPKIAVFSKLGVTTRRPAKNEVMDKEFIDFAKAYLRYQQAHKPTRTRNETKALRALEAALLQVTGSADIAGTSVAVLDEAAVLARQHYGKGAAYHCGRELEILARFMVDHRLVTAGVQAWVSPIKRPHDKNRTGKAGQEIRERRLPDDIALNALAEVFANNPVDGRDIFTTATFAMLMSAPSRISEVLALPVNCEVKEKDRDGKDCYGWRFYGGKGFEGDVKWIPSSMVSIAKKAVKRLQLLSRNARNLAAWIEDHPRKFFRHEGCPQVADDAPLSMRQACQALGLAHHSRSVCGSALRQRGLEARDGVHTLNGLWEHVLGRLPEDFPWFDRERGVRYRDALFALNKNQFHGKRAALPVELHKPTNNFFNSDLSPRVSLGPGKHRSIFDRHGYGGEDGGRLKATSHQARHLLNTIAQRGGLSNLEIAKWSGRADVEQNRTYNHMTDAEMVAMAERIDPSKSLFGPAGAVGPREPVTAQEFNLLDHAAVHVTELGYCVHDYTMSPCEKFRDCMNCTEHVCIKGNKEQLDRIKQRRDRVEKLCQLAEQAVLEGEIGADRWYEAQVRNLARLQDLVSKLEDPLIEDGAQIKLSGSDFCQLRRVVSKKALDAVESDDREENLLNGTAGILGSDLG